ncbi:MAG: glycerol-3-phosphate dehydrogenase [Bacteroidetes bacterium]|nr:glycerol-3-phosphate dehydrogenase [Bacteroidota bacterium]
MQPLQSLTVIGGGSWATALVKIFSESSVHVTWHLRSTEHVDFLLSNGRNPNYLSSVQLDLKYIRPTNNLEDAITSSNDILFAVPSAFLEATLAGLDENSLQDKHLYVSIKGLVSDALLVPSVFIAKRFNTNVKDISVLAGPCHAEEIAMNRKTYLTVSGENEKLVKRMAASIHSHYVSVITNGDPLGVEYAAIMKNIIAIAGGMVKGLNYGDNFLAVIVSNAMREIKNFLHKLDSIERDPYNSAYFGDLLVTAYSEFSRNRNFGFMMGRGYSVPDAKSRMTMIAEGFTAAKGMFTIARQLNVSMPVLSAVYRILYKHAAPYAEFKLLESQLQ